MEDLSYLEYLELLYHFSGQQKLGHCLDNFLKVYIFLFCEVFETNNCDKNLDRLQISLLVFCLLDLLEYSSLLHLLDVELSAVSEDVLVENFIPKTFFGLLLVYSEFCKWGLSLHDGFRAVAFLLVGLGVGAHTWAAFLPRYLFKMFLAGLGLCHSMRNGFILTLLLNSGDIIPVFVRIQKWLSAVAAKEGLG